MLIKAGQQGNKVAIDPEALETEENADDDDNDDEDDDDDDDDGEEERHRSTTTSTTTPQRKIQTRAMRRSARTHFSTVCQDAAMRAYIGGWKYQNAETNYADVVYCDKWVEQMLPAHLLPPQLRRIAQRKRASATTRKSSSTCSIFETTAIKRKIIIKIIKIYY